MVHDDADRSVSEALTRNNTLYNLRATRRIAFFGELSEIMGRPRQSVLVSFARRLRHFFRKKDFYRRLYLNADTDVAGSVCR